ncbi:MAG: UDP-N-acetylglucosamine pyrophosphorylase [Clostridia bacterium]|nr:UDP-N-acetylglucosamine pyrophosphorylase [Clostridia bacterium]
MQKTDLTCRELFGWGKGFSAELLETCEFPWEALERLGEFVSKLGKRLLETEGWKELSEGVVVSEKARISPMATIVGPAVICSGAEIRPGAYIRGKVIVEEDCVVGNSTELKNSILMTGAKLPHYNYAGDSIIGEKAHMGAGAVASNFKLDGSSVRILGIETGRRKLGTLLGACAEVGCHCVLNPGTVIGKNTSVYPGTVVRGVIAKNMIVKTMDEVIPKQ